MESLRHCLPHGKQAAGTPLKNFVPLAPLGPSVVRIAGIPRRGIPAKCQKSVPDSRETFSADVTFASVSSTSKSSYVVRPFTGCWFDADISKQSHVSILDAVRSVPGTMRDGKYFEFVYYLHPTVAWGLSVVAYCPPLARPSGVLSSTRPRDYPAYIASYSIQHTGETFSRNHPP